MAFFLIMLAELSTTRISETTKPETFKEHSKVAQQGGEIARNASLELEATIWEKVVSPLNAKQGILLNPTKFWNYRTRFMLSMESRPHG